MKCHLHPDTELTCSKCVGAKGGRKRAQRHSSEELKGWARLGALAVNKNRKRRRKAKA
jgi:hypothetical protein